MVVNKDYEFKKGDKVRIVDVNAILDGSAEWDNGDIAEFVGDLNGMVNYPRFKSKKRAGKTQYISLDERHAIELVPAFKVGEVVEVVANTSRHQFPIGEHVRITAVGKGGCDAEYLRGTDYWSLNFSDVSKIETKEPTKPKKAERIAQLEKQVAELNEKVAKLERNEAEEAPKIPQLTPNQKRKAIIDEARKFVDREIEARRSLFGYIEVPDSRQNYSPWGCSRIIFKVDAEKRTVVALAVGSSSGKVVEKAVAKCSNGDVFNADIGKTIAVAKLFALDFERFAYAVQPSERVNGMIINVNYGDAKNERMYLTDDVGGRNNGLWKCQVGSTYDKHASITDDTDAQYVD